MTKVIDKYVCKGIYIHNTYIIYNLISCKLMFLLHTFGPGIPSDPSRPLAPLNPYKYI